MRYLLGLISLGCLSGLITSQAIKPNSLLCAKMQLGQTATVAVKNAYKTVSVIVNRFREWNGILQ